jgi:hypothetical protein
LVGWNANTHSNVLEEGTPFELEISTLCMHIEARKRLQILLEHSTTCKLAEVELLEVFFFGTSRIEEVVDRIL